MKDVPEKRKDLVLMCIETFENQEQLLQLQAKVLQAEQERIDKAATLDVLQARKRLRERVKDLQMSD